VSFLRALGQDGGVFARHPILTLATVAYLGLVGWLTLTPQSSFTHSSPLWSLAELFARYSATEWLTFARLEFLANIAMFVPLGLFLVLLLGRAQWWLAMICGLVLTLAIEFAQQFIAGRVSDPRDLVANTLGALLGTVLALVLTAAKARRIRHAAGAVARRPA
jgi:glycopeptide antibiotics resistance protein